MARVCGHRSLTFIPGPRLTAWDFCPTVNQDALAFLCTPESLVVMRFGRVYLSIKSVANTALLLAKYGDKGSCVTN